MNLENNQFGLGEGELIEITYCYDLPMRLDRWLVDQRPEQSRSSIQKFINSGLVLINYKTAKSKTPLKRGDNVQIWLPPPEPLPYLKAERIPLDILFEDKHIIVINKQSGLTVHPAPGHKSGTLVNGLLAHCENLPGINGKLRPGIVHRLDKDTSGCMVVAKDQESLVNLQMQIKNKIASRNYLAIIHGVPNTSEGKIVGNIGRHPNDRKKYAVVDENSGKYACTNWKLVEKFGNYSLMSFKLETGRTHQIRVHMNSIGHSLIGDKIYSGLPKKNKKIDSFEKEIISKCRYFARQALHSNSLSFQHPISKELMHFNVDLPDDMKNLINSIK